MKTVTTDVRHPVYDTSDKIGALKDALEGEPSMADDAELKLRYKRLDESFHALFAHLQAHYLWD